MNFWSVPFQQPGRYIHSMTWQTFEALLQMISTRITLYSFAADATYNARSVSTLANESFFSDLVRPSKSTIHNCCDQVLKRYYSPVITK